MEGETSSPTSVYLWNTPEAARLLEGITLAANDSQPLTELDTLTKGIFPGRPDQNAWDRVYMFSALIIERRGSPSSFPVIIVECFIESAVCSKRPVCSSGKGGQGINLYQSKLFVTDSYILFVIFLTHSPLNFLYS